ncbi:MAG: serine/threonine protein kinase [Myxococcaceae bacterium]|nr:serine/threonine protein kinase [Myxococcaceae bacterium]
MDAPTIIANRRICSKCGLEQPEGASECPRDGNTIFTSPSIALEMFEITNPSAKPKDPLIGERLGDYEVQQVVGEGGMGIVYRGLQPQIQKKVAVKVLRPEVAADPTTVKRFLAEAQAVTAIGHRNIIDVFTLGQLADGRPYIVMEFLEGVPLDKYLKERAPLEPDEALALLLEIVTPLSAAHAAGIIHRDLKPSNVFLVKQSDGARYLKLLDFGLAKRSFDGHSAQTSGMVVTGTPDYMSPEQARGADVSPRSDLYSLGVIAFEMLTGTIPFTGATPMDVLIKHVSEPAPKPSSRHATVSPELDALVMSLMEKTPTARLSPAEKVRQELQRLQRGLAMSTQASTAKVLEPVAPQRSVSSALLLGVALLGVAVLGGSVGLLVTREREPQVPVVVPPPPPAQVVAPVPEVIAPAEPEPAPEPVAPLAPAAGPKPRTKKEGVTLEQLTARVDKLEGRLKRSAEPGEEPDPAALLLLKKLKVKALQTHTPEERAEVQKSLDGWETTFLAK